MARVGVDRLNLVAQGVLGMESDQAHQVEGDLGSVVEGFGPVLGEKIPKADAFRQSLHIRFGPGRFGGEPLPAFCGGAGRLA